MAIIKIKYKAASGSLPTGLTAGELAINLTDREMWVGGTSGAIIRLAGLSANTFTALNTFNAGISAASVRIGTGFITGACANAEMRMSANGDVSIISPTDIILGDSAPNYGANENSIEIQRSANSISVTTENFTIGRSGTSSTIKVGASGVTFDGLTATFNRFARFTSGLCASRAVLGSAAASDGVTIDGVLNCSQPVYFNNSISPGGGIYTQSIAFPYVSFPNASLEVAGSSFSVFFAGISASGITVSGRINLPTRPPKTNDTTAATTAFVQTAITEDTPDPTNLDILLRIGLADIEQLQMFRKAMKNLERY